MNSSPSKNSIRIIVLVCIVAAIGYIELSKPAVMVVPAQNINVTTPPKSTVVVNEASKYPPAKELAGIQGYINSPALLSNGSASSTAPFKLADFIGKKVILVDFWTYSCINCLRTIPYLNAWYQKYRDQGLVIVGVHTPEFDFEKDYSNVTAAVKRLGIQYPVVLDSNMGTWNAYNNQYWPNEFLIDNNGYIIHNHIGEGDYDQTEAAIQAALKERDQALGISSSGLSATTTIPSSVIPMDPSGVQSPETYFGSARNEYFGNGNAGVSGMQSLTLPASPTENTLYLGGTWDFHDQFAENTSSNAAVLYSYNAKNVYLVAAAGTSTPAQEVKVKVFLDGQPIPPAQAGADVAADGTVTISGNRLYSIVNGVSYGRHILELRLESAGLDAFTFTFG